MWSFVTGLFRLAQCVYGSSICSIHPHIIPFYGWIMFYCMDIPHLICWFISPWTLGLFLLFSTFEQCCYEYLSKFSCGHTFSFLWVIEGEPLNLMVTLHLTFWETDRLFSKATALFYISTSMKSSVLTTNKVIYTFIAGLHKKIAIRLSQTLVNPRRNWKVFLMRKLKAELWVWKCWCFFWFKDVSWANCGRDEWWEMPCL